jgi:enoyl-CoA hydratase
MALLVDRQDAVCVLTLDDPDRRIALTPGLVTEIVAAISAVEADARIGALVVTGTPPAFCSGADLGGLAALAPGSGQDPRSVRDVYDGFLAVRECTLPTVAAVNGPAVGAGFNLALACDVRIVAPSARFDSRFATIGLHPGGGHIWMLERAAGAQTAAAANLFRERIDGPRAVELGLAWRCVAGDHLLETAIALASRAARVPRALARRIKATVRDAASQPDFAGALATELENQRWSLEQGYLDVKRRG